MTIKELIEQRNKAVTEAKAIAKRADDEQRSLTQEESTDFEKWASEAEQVGEQIRRAERLATFDREQSESTGRKAAGGETRSNTDGDLLRSFLAGNAGTELQIPLGRIAYQSGDFEKWQSRALSFTASAGGNTLDQDFIGQIEKGLKSFGGIRNAVKVWRTDHGRDIVWPTVDDVSNKVSAMRNPSAQLTSDGSDDPTFAQAKSSVCNIASSIIRIPVELIRDSESDLSSIVADLISERLARGAADFYATGSGTNQPKGLATSATSAVTLAAATPTRAELLTVIHGVDPAYRTNAKWFFNDTTLKALENVVDSEGRPLFTVSDNWAMGTPNKLMGYDYVIDQSLPNLSATGGAKGAICFGDPTKFTVRETPIQLVRLIERYAEFNEVGIVAHQSIGSGMPFAHGGRAVACTTNHA